MRPGCRSQPAPCRLHAPGEPLRVVEAETRRSRGQATARPTDRAGRRAWSSAPRR